MVKYKRIILLIMDSVGIGALPDAKEYGDEGANTIANIASTQKGLQLPNFKKLGLGNITKIEGVAPDSNPSGCFGKMAEISPGKDTTTGHWELAGIVLDQPFPVYPKGFPKEVLEGFEAKINRKSLGNKVASGTQIIEELGEEHMKTGHPIVYTSADSVFQVAAHEEVISLEELYKICESAREILVDDHQVGRVIARPFIGSPGKFKRTVNRKDYAIDPPKETVLDLCVENDIKVMAVGKVKDIFNGRGVSLHKKTKTNDEGIDKYIQFMREEKEGIIFANLVDFDMLYGHRNDVVGYQQALEKLDSRIPEILQVLNEDDLLIITADHGCDPTLEGYDHTREYVPLLVQGPKVRAGVNLGTRKSFSDVAATIAENFNLKLEAGTSFLQEINQEG